MFFWSGETGVTLGFIQPGKPTQNAFVESLNGQFRNECLNRHWFRTMEEARVEVINWQLPEYETLAANPHDTFQNV
ncbi:transposase [Halieaceae bacterium IMCC14734]|uniref:Transposase n=1 Tax=Candidatus Litorirhabdus singularis TaxID=2518993 RepID=A0ABT3TIL5_9GAMM|nr:transposase [Candidatus Litorirhabdus singularis]